LTLEEVKQELLKYHPNPDDAIEVLTELGLSKEEAQKYVDCKIPEDLIYAKAHEIIDDMAKFSDEVLKHFARVMNVDEDNHRFSFKTEFLFKAVYFLAKKQYAHYVVENEGKKIRQISSSGFGTKSDVPEMTNKMVQHLFKVIFYTNADINLIQKAVDIWRKRFEKLIKERSTLIATPCGFNKDLSQYKTLNDCVRGMLLYNELIGQEYFKPGSKGYKIYSKGIDFKKLGMSADQFTKLIENFIKKYKLKAKKVTDVLDRIVIPVDSETIPDWIILDTETIMEKIFARKVNDTLKVMGITFTHNQQDVLLDLF